MNENLTMREKKMLKVIEGVVNGFYDAKMGREFRTTIHVIDEALAEVGIMRTDKDKKVEADSEDSLD
jgi:hypothetical protein